MIELKVFDNLEQAMQLYATLGDKLAPEMSMALNRANRGVQTDVKRGIASLRGVKSSLVTEHAYFEHQYADPDELVAQTGVSGFRIGLEEFKHSPKKFMGGKTSGGVTVTVFGKVRQYKKSFIGLKNTVPLRVLQRVKGKNLKSKNKEPRYRLRHMKAPAIPQVADDDDIVEFVRQNAEVRFIKQFDHVVDRLVEKFG